MAAPRILLAGAGGYGATYVAEIAALERDGVVELAGICEPAPLSREARDLLGNRPVDDDWQALLRKTHPDVAIVATPIYLHLAMARAALEAGADLLLEKPPAATLADWQALVAAPGSPVRQVGFQSLGSRALAELRRLVADGTLGTVEHVGAWGGWLRTDSYYRRAAWAGRRDLDGVPVSDGVFTNAFAHAVQTALAVLGATEEGDVTAVDAELWRLRDIECDDTAWIRLETRVGVPVTAAATLCADEVVEPVVVVQGSRATATLHYTEDVLVIGGESRSFGRTTPLRDLLAHRSEPDALQSPLTGCGGFMVTLEQLRNTPRPARVPDAAIVVDGETRIVPGMTAVCRRAATEGLSFAEAGRPW